MTDEIKKAVVAASDAYDKAQAGAATAYSAWNSVGEWIAAHPKTTAVIGVVVVVAIAVVASLG